MTIIKTICRPSRQARGPTLALKSKADVTRSPKLGYQWPHKKDWCPPKIKKKNNKTTICRPVRSECSSCNMWKTEVQLMMLNRLPCREPLVNLNGVSVDHPEPENAHWIAGYSRHVGMYSVQVISGSFVWLAELDEYEKANDRCPGAKRMFFIQQLSLDGVTSGWLNFCTFLLISCLRNIWRIQRIHKDHCLHCDSIDVQIDWLMSFISEHNLLTHVMAYLVCDHYWQSKHKYCWDVHKQPT